MARTQPAHAASSLAGDSIDRLVAEWRAVRSDLDFSPVEVVSRLRRVRAYVDAALEGTLAACGLSSPAFGVLSALRRQGPPFQLSQRALMDRLGLTSGTVSVRIDQLVDLGMVTRQADPADRRGMLVRLTEAGLDRCDACTPAYLADEDRLLSALTPTERLQLVQLLRRLLVDFEAEQQPVANAATSSVGLALGVRLAPAHVARHLQRQLGLPERVGLLVQAVTAASPAARAGLYPGDLVVSANGDSLSSLAGLADAVALAAGGRLCLGVVRGAEAAHEVAIDVPPGTAETGPATLAHG
jgi:DNA-binding MarR family transcriptional regulator